MLNMMLKWSPNLTKRIFRDESGFYLSDKALKIILEAAGETLWIVSMCLIFFLFWGRYDQASQNSEFWSYPLSF